MYSSKRGMAEQFEHMERVRAARMLSSVARDDLPGWDLQRGALSVSPDDSFQAARGAKNLWAKSLASHVPGICPLGQIPSVRKEESGRESAATGGAGGAAAAALAATRLPNQPKESGQEPRLPFPGASPLRNRGTLRQEDIYVGNGSIFSWEQQQQASPKNGAHRKKRQDKGFFGSRRRSSSLCHLPRGELPVRSQPSHILQRRCSGAVQQPS